MEGSWTVPPRGSGHSAHLSGSGKVAVLWQVLWHLGSPPPPSPPGNQWSSWRPACPANSYNPSLPLGYNTPFHSLSVSLSVCVCVSVCLYVCPPLSLLPPPSLLCFILLLHSLSFVQAGPFCPGITVTVDWALNRNVLPSRPSVALIVINPSGRIEARTQTLPLLATRWDNILFIRRDWFAKCR